MTSRRRNRRRRGQKRRRGGGPEEEATEVGLWELKKKGNMVLGICSAVLADPSLHR